MFINNLFLKLKFIYTLIYIIHCSPDIAKLEDDQKILINDIKHKKDLTDEMYNKFKFLDKKDSLKSINSVSSTIPVEKEGTYVKIDNNYSPPIIVLLPEDSTSREKWEYAVTLKCLGQRNFDAFTNIHNTRMARMAAISGTTVSEINAEIKETEQELESVKKELESLKEQKKSSKPASKNDFNEKTRKLHLDHNIKLLNQEIHVMEIKLERLRKRLKSAILFGKNNEKSTEKGENKENEQYEDEEQYESGSTGGADNGEEYDENSNESEDF